MLLKHTDEGSQVPSHLLLRYKPVNKHTAATRTISFTAQGNPSLGFNAAKMYILFGSVPFISHRCVDYGATLQSL